MNIYKPSQAYYGLFITSDPDTGDALDADSLPTATAVKNGVDDGSFTLTVANIDTGRYKITGTIPAGYVAGNVVQIVVSATVVGVAGKAVVDRFGIDTKLASEVKNDILVDPATDKIDGSNLDAAVSAVKTKTDNLPANPASETTLNSVGVICTENRRLVKNKMTINSATKKLELWNDSGSALLYSWPLTDIDGGAISLPSGYPANRGIPS